MKFKIGDKVKIIENSLEGSRYIHQYSFMTNKVYEVSDLRDFDNWLGFDKFKDYDFNPEAFTLAISKIKLYKRILL